MEISRVEFGVNIRDIYGTCCVRARPASTKYYTALIHEEGRKDQISDLMKVTDYSYSILNYMLEYCCEN